MLIRNAKVFNYKGVFETGDIVLDGDRIASVNLVSGITSDTVPCAKSNNPDDNMMVLDATGLYAIPGLTDLHFHGCAGYDFCDGTKEAFDAITDYEAKNGITTICPATMTLPEDTLTEICRNAASYPNKRGSILCGINLEGPFLSVKKKGAQNEAYLRKPDLAEFHRLNQLSGNLVKLISIAPEEEGAMDFINALKDTVVLSLAHTAADYDTARKAFNKGASHVTHMFNAMLPFGHREPGVIGAAFDDPDCTVELICDGIHLHPAMVRAALKMFGEDRVIFVSDSMMATGFPDGNYALGGQEVKVAGKKATLQDGTIAGSVTNLMACMINAVKNMGIPLETAVKAAAVNPAKKIGIYNKYGSITPGKTANLVLMDQELNIKAVIIKGKKIE